MTPEVGPLWPFKRALADGNAEAFAKIRGMLAVAMAFPGKIDAKGRVVADKNHLEEESNT